MKKNIRVHTLLHAPFEGIGCIENWIRENHIQHAETAFWKKDHQLPNREDLDLLIIMGGPMGVHDEEKYPWLLSEKKFIEAALKNKKHILGICLGAQLIADVLGAKVYKNEHKEIGWFSLKTSAAAAQTLLKFFPKEFITFHWHGDTFEIPAGAKNLASSEATENQAFVIDERVVALQFHPEVTKESLLPWCDETTELKPDTFVQSEQEIKANLHHAEFNHKLLKQLLDDMYEHWRLQQISHVL